ncbi:HD domain-containing protein [Pedobacter sp. MC2016-15]|uniref:HD domain-containing protein n=1 Tax=Pedobacter sp. MC2016-15 TaxID=2994473 RepID=UPI00224637AC|nr:HD domain-containing protein [Pedobacter sp. MC2016-15]MCX2481595.1 HD domain-containing protein [Pedobacter sp. MC2016-15]
MDEEINIDDALYGSIKIDGVFKELVQSSAFQRLKEINQGGAVFMVNPDSNHTRFDHSLGVYWLVTKFGGDLRERTAALLHDLSHTAFSHVVDAVFDHRNEDYHESIFEEVIRNSTIPSILNKYDLSDALDSFERYTLLEQSLPEICADRIDYTLRDLFQARMITSDEVNSFIADLQIENGKFVISTTASEEWFKYQYKRLNEDYFRRPEHLFANQKMAELLKRAVADGNLSKADLMTTDTEVIRKLKSAGFHEEISALRNLDGFQSFDMKRAAQKLKLRVMP